MSNFSAILLVAAIIVLLGLIGLLPDWISKLRHRREVARRTAHKRTRA